MVVFVPVGPAILLHKEYSVAPNPKKIIEIPENTTNLLSNNNPAPNKTPPPIRSRFEKIAGKVSVFQLSGLSKNEERLEAGVVITPVNVKIN